MCMKVVISEVTTQFNQFNQIQQAFISTTKKFPNIISSYSSAKHPARSCVNMCVRVSVSLALSVSRFRQG